MSKRTTDLDHHAYDFLDRDDAEDPNYTICPDCSGRDPDCETCGGTGVVGLLEVRDDPWEPEDFPVTAQ